MSASNPPQCATYEEKIEDLQQRMLRLQDEVVSQRNKDTMHHHRQSAYSESEKKMRELLVEAERTMNLKVEELAEKDRRVKRLLDRIDDLEVERESMQRRMRR